MDGINVEELKEYLEHYDNLKKDDRLFVKVCNTDRSSDMLEAVPHKKISDDLAITFHVLIKEGNADDEFYMQSVNVTNGLFQHWEKEYGLTLDDVCKDALESAQKSQPVTVQEIEGVLAAMMGVSPDEIEKTNLFVVSNSNKINGAAALFYPDSFEIISERLGGSFFCIPSSKHEFLVINDSIMKEHGFSVISDISKMINEVNQSEVSPEDYLSDTLYHYDSEAKIFESAVSYHNRVEKPEISKDEDFAEKEIKSDAR